MIFVFKKIKQTIKLEKCLFEIKVLFEMLLFSVNAEVDICIVL